MNVIVTHLSSGLESWDGAKPILVMLHGYGSNEQDLAGLSGYLHGDFPWVSLRAPLSLAPGSNAWFPLAAPGNPLPENVEHATEVLWAWIDANLPADAKLIALGFSQGGLMASQLLRTRPERIAATVILAGFTLGAEQPADAWLSENRPKVIYCRGLNDGVISGETVARTVGWLEGHTNAQMFKYPGLAHSIDERVLSDVNDYLDQI